MLTVAAEYPDVQFVGMTNQGSRYDDLANTHNAFANIYEGRYVAGVAAGLKMQQLIDDGEITEDQAVIGYVGAYSFAEVVSGFTAYYLGARSVCPRSTSAASSSPSTPITPPRRPLLRLAACTTPAITTT